MRLRARARPHRQVSTGRSHGLLKASPERRPENAGRSRSPSTGLGTVSMSNGPEGGLFTSMRIIRASFRMLPWGLLWSGTAIACLCSMVGFWGRIWWPFELASHFRVQYFFFLLEEEKGSYPERCFCDHQRIPHCSIVFRGFSRLW